jgi:RNA polymerase sigma factor (sigma-70 family)
MQWSGLPAYVYRTLLRRCRGVRAIGYDDAVQEGYVALLKAAELWDPDRGPTFAGYAIRAIVNQLLDAADRWVTQVPLNGLGRDAPDASAPPRDRLDADLEARLARALARLESREAEVVARCIQEGEPLRTVAARWRTSRQFVVYIKGQALARLRRAFGLED